MKTSVQFFLLFIFLIIHFSIWSQTPAIDSLSALIAKATSDTQRINLINKKVNFFGNINLDSAINIGNANILHAQKINYQKGVADGINAISTSLMFKGEYVAAADKLGTALKIYTQLNDSAGLLRIYSSFGMYYGMQSIYDTSIMYFKRSLSMALLRHDKKMINIAYQNIATSYQMLSDYSNSLQYYQKALKSAEEDNNYVTQAYIYMNLGMEYSSIQDTPRAEQSYLKSIVLSKKANMKNVELYAYSNIASLYGALKRYKEAYDYAIKASELGKETGDIGMEASALSRAGNQLANMNKFSEAEVLIKKGMLLADSSKQPLNIYQTNCDYGLILKMQGRYKEAIPYYEKAFGVMKKSDIYDNQVGSNYADFSECYEKTGNYQKALQTYKLSAQIADSIRSKDNIRKATELALNYEFDKKQQLAKADQQKKDEVAKAKQTALIVGLVLTIGLAGFAFYAFSNKNKANTLLEAQKKEIQSTLSELKITQAQLIQSEKMASLGELTAGIAHEIQNPLNFVNNFSEINQELISELVEEVDRGNKEEVKAIANNIKDNEQKITYHGKRADSIVKGMLQHSRQTNGIKEPTDINALCDEYLRLSYHGLRAKDKSFNADFKTEFDESIGKISIVRQDVGRVLLNLFNNAFYAVSRSPQSLKGSEYKPLVTVSTKKIIPLQEFGSIEIIVSDNGNGIPSSIKDKIFQPFFTTKPTGEGTGLGLSLAYDIITKEHNGTIKVESKEGEGTTLIINLPVARLNPVNQVIL